MRICFIVLQGVRRLKADLARLRMQVLYLQEHHALLGLGLSAELLHLDVYVAVDFLEEKYVLRVKISWGLHLLNRRRVDLGSLTKRVGHLEVFQP